MSDLLSDLRCPITTEALTDLISKSPVSTSVPKEVIRMFADWQMGDDAQKLRAMAQFHHGMLQPDLFNSTVIPWQILSDFMGGQDMLDDTSRRWLLQLERGLPPGSQYVITELEAFILREQIMRHINTGARLFGPHLRDHVFHLVPVEAGTFDTHANGAETGTYSGLLPPFGYDPMVCSLLDFTGQEVGGSPPLLLRPSRVAAVMEGFVRRLDNSGAEFPWLSRSLSSSSSNATRSGYECIDDDLKGRGGIVCAGGALVASLLDCKVRDWDLYIVAQDNKSAVSVLHRTLCCLNRVAAKEGKEVTFKTKGHVVDVNFRVLRRTTAGNLQESGEEQDDDEERSYSFDATDTFQVIFRRFSCAEDVVHGFDLDCCALLFLGPTPLTLTSHPGVSTSCTVYATKSATVSLGTRVILYNPTRISTTFEARCIKYVQRYKFRILVADMPQEITDELVAGVHRAIRVMMLHKNELCLLRLQPSRDSWVQLKCGLSKHPSAVYIAPHNSVDGASPPHGPYIVRNCTTHNYYYRCIRYSDFCEGVPGNQSPVRRILRALEEVSRDIRALLCRDDAHFVPVSTLSNRPVSFQCQAFANIMNKLFLRDINLLDPYDYHGSIVTEFLGSDRWFRNSEMMDTLAHNISKQGLGRVQLDGYSNAHNIVSLVTEAGQLVASEACEKTVSELVAESRDYLKPTRKPIPRSDYSESEMEIFRTARTVTDPEESSNSGSTAVYRVCHKLREILDKSDEPARDSYRSRLFTGSFNPRKHTALDEHVLYDLALRKHRNREQTCKDVAEFRRMFGSI